MQERLQSFVHVLRAFERAEVEFDPIVGKHAKRVGELAAEIAKVAGIPKDEVELVKWAGGLHDIGKLGVPTPILHKPDLDEDEWAKMRSHATIGEAILLDISPELAPIAHMIRSHHERWDGSGYPDGRAGEEIPKCSQIVAIADAFDAITHSVLYVREARLVGDARKAIGFQAGSGYDPQLVQAFETVLETQQRRRNIFGLGRLRFQSRPSVDDIEVSDVS